MVKENCEHKSQYWNVSWKIDSGSSFVLACNEAKQFQRKQIWDSEIMRRMEKRETESRFKGWENLFKTIRNVKLQ